MVNKEELEDQGHFTDNDILAALVAECLQVDQALLLTDVAGLMRHRQNGECSETDSLIRTVVKVTTEIKKLVRDTHSKVGIGGMQSKIAAAERMSSQGIEVIIGNGRLSLHTLLNDPSKRTVFLPQNSSS